MDTTRRMFVGMGAAATAAAAAGIAPAIAQPANKSKFWIAAVTPCDKSNKFDPGAYREQLTWWKSQGADGVLVLGTNGEGPSFSVAERKAVASFALKNKMGLDMIVGTGTANYQEAIELSQHAAGEGADSVLITPPFFFKSPRQDGVVNYFDLIFTQVKSPVLYYHIPRVTGVPVDVTVLKALTRHPNFIGLKNSNGDAAEHQTFVTGLPASLNIISGTDSNMLAALRHGSGVILGSGNIYTKQVAAIFAAHRAGRDPQPEYDRLMAAVKLMQANGYGSNYNAIKYALNQMMGVSRINYARPPHVPLTDQEMANLRTGVAQLKAMG